MKKLNQIPTQSVAKRGDNELPDGTFRGDNELPTGTFRAGPNSAEYGRLNHGCNDRVNRQQSDQSSSAKKGSDPTAGVRDATSDKVTKILSK